MRFPCWIVIVQMWPIWRKELHAPHGGVRAAYLNGSYMLSTKLLSFTSCKVGWTLFWTLAQHRVLGKLLDVQMRTKKTTIWPRCDTPLWESEGMRWTQASIEQQPRQGTVPVTTTKAIATGPEMLSVFLPAFCLEHWDWESSQNNWTFSGMEDSPFVNTGFSANKGKWRSKNLTGKQNRHICMYGHDNNMDQLTAQIFGIKHTALHVWNKL